MPGPFFPVRPPKAGQFPFSRVGLGTAHFSRQLRPAAFEAAEAAFAKGVNWVDLADTFAEGAATEELSAFFKTSKQDPEAIAIVAKSNPRLPLSPQQLRNQLDRYRNRLGRFPDFFVIRGPEFSLPPLAHDLSALTELLRECFAFLAHSKEKGEIRGFGVASEGVVLPKEDEAYLSLEMIVEAAMDELGSDFSGQGFQLVQTPFNLLEPGAVATDSCSGNSPAEYLLKKGLQWLTYRPLQAWRGDRWVQLSEFSSHHQDPDLEKRVNESLTRLADLESTWTGTPSLRPRFAHDLQARGHEFLQPLRWSNVLRSHTPRLSAQIAQEPGAAAYYLALKPLLAEYTRLVEKEAAIESRRYRALLDESAPMLAKLPSLPARLMALYQSIPAVTGTAWGLTHPAHLESLQAGASATLRPGEAIRCFQFVDEWSEINE